VPVTAAEAATATETKTGAGNDDDDQGKGSDGRKEHRSEGDGGFEVIMEGLLADYLESRQTLWAQQSSHATLCIGTDGVGGGTEDGGQLVRPLSRFETARIVAAAKQWMAGRLRTPAEWIVLRKVQLQQERRKAGIKEPLSLDIGTLATVTPLDVPPSVPIPRAVIDALRNVHTTRYENSFAARIYGNKPPKALGLIAVDWESRPPWMLLMEDVHAHYGLAHPERSQPERTPIPITYVSLQPSHLRQVHELLARVFWEGVDVSDALHYSPERCTVIATYGHLVIGAAFLSSPQETYITYLVVRAGWENAQIATTMLYHLIALHPHRDITLHVSVNNPAMLLYNRFGFKAEEFIAGFYEAYLDTHSRASKNAFRLRLRR